MPALRQRQTFFAVLTPAGAGGRQKQRFPAACASKQRGGVVIFFSGNPVPLIFRQVGPGLPGAPVASVRKFLKNQALPVFQKFWRLAFKLV
jgi:hypothetical protein